MTIRLTDIKGQLTGGGARPNLFRIEIPAIPAGVSALSTDAAAYDATNFEILCKAGGIPASTVGVVEVPFRGRTFKVAGDRTFDTWTVTVINDDDYQIRRVMEDWVQAVAQMQDGSGLKDPQDYMGTATVTQLTRLPSNVGDGDNEGTGLANGAQYEFTDIFPTNLSQIDLSYDSTDTIEEFTVEFQVNYWTRIG